jgi:hypothetical protein
MRPIIDIDNLSYSKETLIYYTRTNILLRILLLIGLIAAIVYYSKKDLFIIALLLAGIFFFQIPYLIKSLKRIDELQIRINAEGIQYRDETFISWSNIENERVVKEYRNKEDHDGTDYFIYYIIEPGQVMRFNIEELSTGASELQHTLTIHRNRFKRANNIL